jgi:DnaJ-class molecular chaperone
MYNNNKRDKMKQKKTTGATVDLFGATDCEDCNGTGQVDTTPKGATYERLEDCDACNGMGSIWK